MNQNRTIFDNGDYSLYAQITPTISPKNGHTLTITSRWKSSSNPDEEQIRFRACLEHEGLQALAAIIQNELSSKVSSVEE